MTHYASALKEQPNSTITAIFVALSIATVARKMVFVLLAMSLLS